MYSNGLMLSHNQKISVSLNIFIQMLNAFCDHPMLAESFTALQLTLLLLQTDDSHDSKVKDISQFIKMIILWPFTMGWPLVVFWCIGMPPIFSSQADGFASELYLGFYYRFPNHFHQMGHNPTPVRPNSLSWYWRVFGNWHRISQVTAKSIC